MNMTRPTVQTTWVAAAGAAALLLLSGCPAPVQPLPPAITIEQVVQQVNRNNALLPWFKARVGSMQVTLYDEGGWPHKFDLFGHMIYAQPNHLYMDAFIAGEKAMGLGGNDEQYWLWIRPVYGRCWVGSDSGREPTGAGRMLINPRQLVRLLGVDAIPAELARTPLAVLRTSSPADRANIIQFIDLPRRRSGAGDPDARSSAAPVLVRELWVDRDSNRPIKVVLFDRFGQPVIESALSDWRMVTRGSAGWFPFQVDIRSIRRKATEYGRPPRPGVIETTAGRMRLTFVEVEVDERFDPDHAGPLYEFQYPPDLTLEPVDGRSDAPMEAPGE